MYRVSFPQKGSSLHLRPHSYSRAARATEIFASAVVDLCLKKVPSPSTPAMREI
jgi:hypothetical protein